MTPTFLHPFFYSLPFLFVMLFQRCVLAQTSPAEGTKVATMAAQRAELSLCHFNCTPKNLYDMCHQTFGHKRYIWIPTSNLYGTKDTWFWICISICMWSEVGGCDTTLVHAYVYVCMYIHTCMSHFSLVARRYILMGYHKLNQWTIEKDVNRTCN